MASDPDIPDYSRCTLDDLLDVRRRIDAARFPERAAALEAEIAARQSGVLRPAAQDPVERSWRPSWFRDPRTLGLYMVVAGGWALAAIFDAATPSTGALSLRLIGIPFVACALMVAAGGLAALGLPGWRWAALVAWAVQVPAVRIGRIAYSVLAPPAIEFKLWPELGFAAALSPQITVWWFAESQPLYLGINCLAFSASGFLVDRLVRRRAARRRQESARSAALTDTRR